jgi:CBS domain-containing protein
MEDGAMKASDVMTTGVLTVAHEVAVTDIAKLLLDRRITAVPVVEVDGRIVGIVSEADLVRRPETGTERRRSWWLRLAMGDAVLAEDYVKSHGLTARDVMTRPVVTVPADASLDAAVALMEKHRVKRLPVVDGGRPVGIISRADVLRAVAARMEDHTNAGDRAIRAQVLEELRGQSWPTIPDRNVVVSDGVVSFWGDVASEEERRALCVAAGGVPGVRAVEDHMTVRPTIVPAGAMI